jgi:hydrogenase-1 operon protein HyaE
MPSPLIDRLTTELGWPLLDGPDLEAFAAGAGERALFVTGDPAKNLESNDLAVILPEIARAFGGRFAVGVVAQPSEKAVRDRYETWATPSVIFLRDGAFLGAIPKIRDWSDYLDRTRAILDGAGIAAE